VPNQKTVAFFPEPGAWGPTNNCVAIADVLRGRGVRCVFVVESSFKGVLEERGFEEAIFRTGPPPEHEEQVGAGWAEWIRQNVPEFRKPTIEQLTTVIEPIWQELVSYAEYAHERMVEIYEEIGPDAIVTDNVCAYPAVQTAGVPWVRSVSANPLELDDPELPPALSGYPVDDRSLWDAFRAEERRVCHATWSRLSEFCIEQGAGPLPEGKFQYDSPWLNVYLYPEPADYPRSRPLAPTWHRLDATIRTSDRPWDVEERLPGDGKVIYLSLGSLGCMDVELMQRLIDVLDRTPHRVVVSMGPLHEQLRLGERMAGEQFLPQVSILPQCDLLITHGGNNTFAESFYFGLPTIVLPLFWDQYDNAQRAQDTGFGIRLPTHDWEDEDLLGAVQRLLADRSLDARLGSISKQLAAARGAERGADLLWRLLETGEPVTR
jgi:UDP:flavonoid glycosyltransferase YjiC (YdhE family)